MQRTSPETRSFRVRLRPEDNDILPHHIYLDGSRRYEAIALERDLLEGTARLNLAEIQDGGTSGLSTTTSFEGETEPSGGGGGGSSVQVLDGGDGSGGTPDWTDVKNKPGDLFARDGDSDGFTNTRALPDSLAHTDESTTFEQDLTVQGDVTVSGDKFLSDAETTILSDNVLFIDG